MMSQSANVRATQTLSELQGALARFGAEAREALAAADQDVRRTLDWLQERLNHWQNEVRRRQEEARRTEAALARCLASAYRDRNGYDHTPDCSAYEQAVFQAQRRLQEAEAELRNVQEWLRLLGEAAAPYRAQSQRLSRQLAMDLPSADAFLGRRLAELQAYLAVSAPAGAGATVSAGSAAAVGIRQWNAAGSSVESERLTDGLGRLEGSRAGRPIAMAISERGTSVRFGDTGEGAIARFDGEGDQIVIHEHLRDALPSVLAAHLAHEGTHLQWNRPDSIEQEYHAFRAEAEVWNELKGNETDEQCDWVSAMIALGEEQTKGMIRRLYPDLPEYA
jgi:hypothetical protein